jgi:predicted DNA-binding transcriptional regulator YafY
VVGREAKRGRPCSEVVYAVLDHLVRVPGGLSKRELAEQIGNTSAPTIQRACNELRDRLDAPLQYVRGVGKWRLTDPSFRLPMQAPEPDDVRAVLLAEAMLEPFADASLRKRLRRLAEQLDEYLRTRRPREAAGVRVPVHGRATLGTRFDAQHLATLLDAAQRHPVRIVYDKPWADARVRYTLEPWGVCVFDGAPYVRGHVREARGARTFRLAQIRSVFARPGDRFVHPIPRPDRIWGDDAPAFGIDVDRPDVAVLRIRGAVARWVHPTIWHPHQEDRWIVQGELLERMVPYRSCRELARRVLAILDGIESIAPAALREHVDAIATAHARRVTSAASLAHEPAASTLLPAAPLSRARRRTAPRSASGASPGPTPARKRRKS